MLKELEEKHASKELSIMDLHNSIDLSISQLKYVSKFIERVLDNGNASEILLMKKPIMNQIRRLVNNLPILDNIDVSLKFVNDQKIFERVLRDTYGRFINQNEIKQVIE